MRDVEDVFIAPFQLAKLRMSRVRVTKRYATEKALRGVMSVELGHISGSVATLREEELKEEDDGEYLQALIRQPVMAETLEPSPREGWGTRVEI